MEFAHYTLYMCSLAFIFIATSYYGNKHKPINNYENILFWLSYGKTWQIHTGVIQEAASRPRSLYDHNCRERAEWGGGVGKEKGGEERGKGVEMDKSGEKERAEKREEGES